LGFTTGVTSTLLFDPDNLYRLTNKKSVFSGVALQDLSYAYDPVGNITRIVDAGSELPKDATFAYDELDRLVVARIEAAGELIEESYSYSPVGNILSKTGIGAYTYDDPRHPHAVTEADDHRFDYDANGNMIAKTDGSQVTTFAYDFQNRLTSIVTARGTSVYAYRDDYHRVQKQLLSGTTINYIGELSEIDESGFATNYIFGGNDRIATTDESGIYYSLTDHLSSATLQVDGVGTVVQKIDYLPFGGERVNLREAGFESRFTFTDQEHDSESGLLYYGARYYDPHYGRFTQQDPALWYPKAEVLADPQFLNIYSYGINNPVRFVDPTGESVVDFASGLGLGIAHGAIGAVAGFVEIIVDPYSVALQMREGIFWSFGVIGDYYSNPELAFANTSNAAQEHLHNFEISNDFEKGEVIGNAVGVVAATALMEGAARPKVPGSIPAIEAGSVTNAERIKVTEIGKKQGCHTCGIKDPGTKTGYFVPDHQPPSALIGVNQAQRLFAQCLPCSRVQGGQISQIVQQKLKRFQGGFTVP